MWTAWRICVCSLLTVFVGLGYCKLVPTESSFYRRNIDVTATAQIKIDDDDEANAVRQRSHRLLTHIKPTSPVSVHKRRKSKTKRKRRKTKRKFRKGNKRSNIFHQSVSLIGSKRSLPLENPHPREATLQVGENAPAVPEVQESNLNVDFNTESSDLIGKSEVGTSSESSPSSNNTIIIKGKSPTTTVDEENDEEELDDIKPTDSPDDDEVPPTAVTDINDETDFEGSGGNDIDDDVKESMDGEGAAEDPGDSELDTDEDEDEEADETSPTADPSSEKKAIIKGNNSSIIEPIAVNKSQNLATPDTEAEATTKTDVTNSTINSVKNENNTNATAHPAEIERVENTPSDKINITSTTSDAEKDFAKLQKLEQDINRIAGDLQNKRNEIIKRISMKRKQYTTDVLQT